MHVSIVAGGSTIFILLALASGKMARALTLAGTLGVSALAYYTVEIPSINFGRALAQRMTPR